MAAAAATAAASPTSKKYSPFATCLPSFSAANAAEWERRFTEAAVFVSQSEHTLPSSSDVSQTHVKFPRKETGVYRDREVHFLISYYDLRNRLCLIPSARARVRNPELALPLDKLATVLAERPEIHTHQSHVERVQVGTVVMTVVVRADGFIIKQRDARHESTHVLRETQTFDLEDKSYVLAFLACVAKPEDVMRIVRRRHEDENSSFDNLYDAPDSVIQQRASPMRVELYSINNNITVVGPVSYKGEKLAWVLDDQSGLLAPLHIRMGNGDMEGATNASAEPLLTATLRNDSREDDYECMQIVISRWPGSEITKYFNGKAPNHMIDGAHTVAEIAFVSVYGTCPMWFRERTRTGASFVSLALHFCHAMHVSVVRLKDAAVVQKNKTDLDLSWLHFIKTGRTTYYDKFGFQPLDTDSSFAKTTKWLSLPCVTVLNETAQTIQMQQTALQALQAFDLDKLSNVSQYAECISVWDRLTGTQDNSNSILRSVVSTQSRLGASSWAATAQQLPRSISALQRDAHIIQSHLRIDAAHVTIKDLLLDVFDSDASRYVATHDALCTLSVDYKKSFDVVHAHRWLFRFL